MQCKEDPRPRRVGWLAGMARSCTIVRILLSQASVNTSSAGEPTVDSGLTPSWNIMSCSRTSPRTRQEERRLTSPRGPPFGFNHPVFPPLRYAATPQSHRSHGRIIPGVGTQEK